MLYQKRLERHTRLIRNAVGSPETETLELTEEEIDETVERELVLFNDDHNDMDYVTALLVRVCEITEERAERIMIEAHRNGKATIMTGTFNELKPYREGICDGGVWAEIL